MMRLTTQDQSQRDKETGEPDEAISFTSGSEGGWEKRPEMDLARQPTQHRLADHDRTRGVIARSHEALVQALGGDKGNISHSLRTLEARGWIVLGRTPGGRTESLYLTPTGLEQASEICTKL